MLWDLFCRVVDNHGDLGVCWRLAADLASRGEPVRLWVDDAAALSWMAPAGAAGVAVLPWGAGMPLHEPGDVVVEAFGCDPPAAFVARMHRADPPVWINLEYLSAEPYVERSHGLRSPQFAGPGAGLDKWFYYPGFSAATGGLLREPGLAARRAAFDREAWLRAWGLRLERGERVVSLFCYDNPAAPALIEQLAAQPTLLLAAPGAATRLAIASTDAERRHGALRLHALPWLTQTDYDALLWSADLNFVRGEDSFVRAQWAGAPFVWQIYPQHDRAHAVKLDAFLHRHLTGTPPALAGQVRALWRAWNGFGDGLAALPDEADWALIAGRWRVALEAHADLVTRLLAFVARKRSALPPGG